MSPTQPTVPATQPEILAAGPAQSSRIKGPVPLIAINGRPICDSGGPPLNREGAPSWILPRRSKRGGKTSDEVAGRLPDKRAIIESASLKEATNEDKVQLDLTRSEYILHPCVAGRDDNNNHNNHNNHNKKKEGGPITGLRPPFNCDYKTNARVRNQDGLSTDYADQRVQHDVAVPGCEARPQAARVQKEPHVSSSPRDSEQRDEYRQEQPHLEDVFAPPHVSELPKLLRETDRECRLASRQAQYWQSDEERELWQRLLVAKLVRAKHERLDETQGALLRYLRRLSGIEMVEMWYRVREVRLTQEKEKARKAKTMTKEEKERMEEEKRKMEAERAWRQKSAEAARMARKLVEIREGRRGQDYGLLAAMS